MHIQKANSIKKTKQEGTAKFNEQMRKGKRKRNTVMTRHPNPVTTELMHSQPTRTRDPRRYKVYIKIKK